ncbi:TPA: hypothetical protein QCU60_004503 [Bacillus cereus]|nr:hypothetical protein [Bacillus cereus]
MDITTFGISCRISFVAHPSFYLYGAEYKLSGEEIDTSVHEYVRYVINKQYSNI